MTRRPHVGWLTVGVVVVALSFYRAGEVGGSLALLVAAAGALICVMSFMRGGVE